MEHAGHFLELWRGGNRVHLNLGLCAPPHKCSYEKADWLREGAIEVGRGREGGKEADLQIGKGGREEGGRERMVMSDARSGRAKERWVVGQGEVGGFGDALPPAPFRVGCVALCRVERGKRLVGIVSGSLE